MDPDRPLYHSIAITPEQLAEHAELGWEYTPPRHGVIYGRKHISGPVTDCPSFQPRSLLTHGTNP